MMMVGGGDGDDDVKQKRNSYYENIQTDINLIIERVRNIGVGVEEFPPAS